MKRFKVYILDQGLLTNIHVTGTSASEARMAVMHTYPNVIVREIYEIKQPKPHGKSVA
jgi:hypothetical protein